MRRRTGFTYIEMLTVIAIIGVLVALLLPAVQAAREAARRMSCGNNLQQLILAVQEYESAHQVFPPGTIAAKGPILNIPQGYHHNWVSQILPYLEFEAVARHIDYRAGVYDAANRPPRRQGLKLFRCPSSPAVGPGYSDYAGVHNDQEVPIDVDNNGVFFLNSSIRYDDVVDGLSNTIVIGEKATLQGDLGWMSGTRATLRNLGTLNSGGWRNRYRAPWANGNPPGVTDDDSLAATLSDEVLRDYLFPQDPSAWSYSDVAGAFRPRPPEDVRLAVGGFSSVHPGGTQFALGDGSVRFTSETLDVRVRWRLGNRADRSLQTSWDW